MSVVGSFPTPWFQVETSGSKSYGNQTKEICHDDNKQRLTALVNSRSTEKGVLDWGVRAQGDGIYEGWVTFSGTGTESEEELEEPVIGPRWAVINDEIDRSIFDHWRTNALEEAYRGTVYYVQKKAEEFFANPVPGTTGITVPDLVGDAQTDANKLFFLIIGGSDSWEDDVPVLQKITILPAGSNKVLEWTNAGTIFSDVELAAAEPTIPIGIKTGLPTGFYKKKKPTCTQLADGSLEARVSYQYVGTYYSDYLYSGPLL